MGTSACGSPAPPRPTSITYCTGAASGTLDLYRPTPAPRHPVPVVVWLHGGGWVAGDGLFEPDSAIGDVESAVVGRGWLFASVDYGLAPANRWPAQIADAKCAIRYLRAHAAALQVDQAHVGVIGASAGGQLAALLGLAGPTAGFDTGQYLDQSSAVQAVVDEYGPTDLNAPSWSTTPLAEHLSPEVFGVPARPPSAVLAGASPVTYVRTAAPPFLVVQGAQDLIVAPAQSRELVERLQAAGAPARLVMVQHASHGLEPVGGRTPEPSIPAVTDQEVQFLVAHLG